MGIPSEFWASPRRPKNSLWFSENSLTGPKIHSPVPKNSLAGPPKFTFPSSLRLAEKVKFLLCPDPASEFLAAPRRPKDSLGFSKNSLFGHRPAWLRRAVNIYFSSKKITFGGRRLKAPKFTGPHRKLHFIWITKTHLITGQPKGSVHSAPQVPRGGPTGRAPPDWMSRAAVPPTLNGLLDWSASGRVEARGDLQQSSRKGYGGISF